MLVLSVTASALRASGASSGRWNDYTPSPLSLPSLLNRDRVKYNVYGFAVRTTTIGLDNS